MFKFLSAKTLKSDAIAGIIVFLIALPLCLGIAQASNAPLFAGIVSGIVGGVVIGFFSKSSLSVSGPAAGLVAIIIGALDSMESFQFFLCAVIVAGVVQLIFGLLKAGLVANYFPSSVIEGMLAGIGVTIIIKQLPDALGYNKEAHLRGLQDGERGINLETFTGMHEHFQIGSIIITLIGVGILILWTTKSFSKFKLVPSALLVVVLGILINYLLLHLMPQYALTPDFLVQLNEPANAREFFGQFSLPDFNGFKSLKVYETGVIIAIVASIETLLCIEATDKLDPQRRYTPPNSELRAQGIGNIISGFIGGLPITSVIVRSSANINSGAKTKMSTIFHGILLLVSVSVLPFLLNMIPKAALAAILIFTGYKLANPAKLLKIYKSGLRQFIPFIITAVAVALPFLGLLKGVGLGMIISIYFLLRTNLKIPFYYRRVKTDDVDVTRLNLAQEVSFLNKGSIKETLEALPKKSSIILDASTTEYIDHDVLEVIKTFYEIEAPLRDIKMSMIGFKNIYRLPEGEKIVEPNREIGLKSAGKYTKLIKELEEN